jgi:hypothetical protein
MIKAISGSTRRADAATWPEVDPHRHSELAAILDRAGALRPSADLLLTSLAVTVGAVAVAVVLSGFGNRRASLRASGMNCSTIASRASGLRSAANRSNKWCSWA